MITFERHDVHRKDLIGFMEEHRDETIVFRGHMIADIFVIDLMQDLSKAEYNMVVLNNLLKTKNVKLVDEEKAALDYAIECIKTLDDMGILKGEQNID